MNIFPLDWVLALMVLLIVGGLLYQLMMHVPYERLVRCPVENAITYIEVRPAPAEQATPSGVVVHHCGLWGGSRECSQGCLARFDETQRGFRIDQQALRKFDLKSGG